MLIFEPTNTQVLNFILYKKEIKMNKDFENCISVILANEGGYVWHPSDPGGETNFGITKK